jgi:hypothetical protein
MSNIEKEFDIEEIVKTFFKTLDYTLTYSNEISDYEQVIAIANYKLGLFYHNKKENKKALNHFIESIKCCRNEEKVIIYLYSIECVETKTEILQFLNDTIELIKNNKLTFNDDINRLIPPFTEQLFFGLLIKIYNYLNIDVFISLLEYSVESLYLEKIEINQLIFKIATFSIKNNNIETAASLLEYLLSFNNLDLSIQKTAHCVIGLYKQYNNNKESIKHLKKYVSIFNETKNNNLQIRDFNAFIKLSTFYREHNNFKESFHISRIIEPYINEQLSYDCQASSTVIFFYILDFYSLLGDQENISIYATKILTLINKLQDKTDQLTYIDNKGLEAIKTQTNLILNRTKDSRKKLELIKLNREPARNELIKVIYSNGEIKTIKYKKVQNDLKKGLCKLA